MAKSNFINKNVQGPLFKCPQKRAKLPYKLAGGNNLTLFMKSIFENRRERRITFSLSCGGTFGNELLERTTFEGEHLRDAGRGQPAADPFVGIRVMHIRGGEGEGGGAGHSVNPLRPQHRKQVGGHCARTSEVIFHLSHKVRAS